MQAQALSPTDVRSLENVRSFDCGQDTGLLIGFDADERSFLFGTHLYDEIYIGAKFWNPVPDTTASSLLEMLLDPPKCDRVLALNDTNTLSCKYWARYTTFIFCFTFNNPEAGINEAKIEPIDIPGLIRHLSACLSTQATSKFSFEKPQFGLAG